MEVIELILFGRHDLDFPWVYAGANAGFQRVDHLLAFAVFEAESCFHRESGHHPQFIESLEERSTAPVVSLMNTGIEFLLFGINNFSQAAHGEDFVVDRFFEAQGDSARIESAYGDRGAVIFAEEFVLPASECLKFPEEVFFAVYEPLGEVVVDDHALHLLGVFQVVEVCIQNPVIAGVDKPRIPVIYTQAVALQEGSKGTFIGEEHFEFLVDLSLSAHRRCQKESNNRYDK